MVYIALRVFIIWLSYNGSDLFNKLELVQSIKIPTAAFHHQQYMIGFPKMYFALVRELL